MSGWVLDEYILPGATLRQGDFIKFEDKMEITRRFGIVVTADCDLEQRKHANIITLVPVISAATVLEHYLIPEDCEKKRDLIDRYVFNTLSIDTSQNSETKIALLAEIYERRSQDFNGEMQSAINFTLDKYSKITLTEYKLFMKNINSKPKKPEAFRQQLRSRGDLLVLPDAKSYGVDAAVAWMRHIWQVPTSDVAIRTSDVGRRSGERMARLDTPYRYRLTQLMAQVFSDIGLPSTSDTVDENIEDAYNNA